MFDFVQPAGTGGRTIDERGFARADEADWRVASPTGRGGEGRYGFQRLIVSLPLGGDRADRRRWVLCVKFSKRRSWTDTKGSAG